MLRTYVDLLWAVIQTGALIAAVLFVYIKWVRPILVKKGVLAFEERWATWFSKRWDVAGATFGVAILGSWNTILDIVVEIVRAFPHALEAFSQVDLTSIWLPEKVRVVLQSMISFLPVIRFIALWLVKQEEDE